MIRKIGRPTAIRCAIYTRKSTEEGLEQEFNSLDAQRESGEAYIKSQAHEGWTCLPDRYDDGGYTGGNMDRPAVKRLLADIEAGRIDCVVVYKVDRLSRSLLDFARLMETFEKHRISFVSVTQQFNTATSMGRLILNVLLSFAQFEREMISERTRDKIAAARRKGKWSGGAPVLGYDVVNTKLVVNPDEACRVREIFELYLTHEALLPVVGELRRREWRTKSWVSKKGRRIGGLAFNKTNLYQLLTNVAYAGQVRYKDEVHAGEHQAIVEKSVFDRVRAVLDRNRRSGGAEVRNKHGAMLRGLLHCAACGRAMSHAYTSKGSRRYRYYVCTTAQKQGWEHCPTKSVPAGEIERCVVEQIRNIGRDPDLAAAVLAEARQQTEAEMDRLETEQTALARELKRHHVDLKKLSGASAGEMTAARMADVQERIATAGRRSVDIEIELQRLQTDLFDDVEMRTALARFEPVWDAMSPHEQAGLLQLLIEHVEYDGRDGRLAVTFHVAGIRNLGQIEEEPV